MNESTTWQDQLLATKFYVPAPPQTLVPRPRLMSLLDEGLQRKLTLVSAPAGFGKTTLVSEWVQARQQDGLIIAWVSLDESDNDPVRFWRCVLTALDSSYSDIGRPALAALRGPQLSSLQYALTMLINAMAVGAPRYHLILDDYHVISEPAIHDTLRFLLEHQPSNLHLFLLTRADPPLPVSRLRTLGQNLEVRINHLRFTSEEVADFLQKATDLSLDARAIAAVETRTEGWIASLQLAALSMRGQMNPTDLLAKLRGDQRYILDYLTDEVLHQQPPAIQNFLETTAVLERLSAALCDDLLEQTGSQETLEYLERTNLFTISLDNERRWYRYHALFAEALRYRLQQLDGRDISRLHQRASRWFAAHGYLNEAIQHAFQSQEWQWAADLIESHAVPGTPLFSQGDSWTVQRWLQQLPEEVIRARPHLCLAYARSLRLAAQTRAAETWLQAAEAALLPSASPPAPLTTGGLALDHRVESGKATQGSATIFQPGHERDRLLGEILALRALVIATHYGDSQATREVCRQAEAHLLESDRYERGLVAFARNMAFTADGEAEKAAQSALESSAFLQASGMIGSAISHMGIATIALQRQARLHESLQTCRRAVQLATKLGGPTHSALSLIYARQADILLEWNQLEAANDLISQGSQLSQQPGNELYSSNIGIVLARIQLAQGNVQAAISTIEQVAEDPLVADSPHYSAGIADDQARVWLAGGDLERARRWVRELENSERPQSSFARECQDIARIRVWLAEEKTTPALESLAPLLVHAQATRRWDNVIEMLLLHAYAYHLSHQTDKALFAVAQAISIAQPEGYIRRFLDEGPYMAALLSTQREQERRLGPTPYLDSLLEAFLPEKAGSQSDKPGGEATGYRLPYSPLSEREREVLRLLAGGASNQDIATELVVALSTVKHHVSTILEKLGVRNRTQAVAKARSLGLLRDET